MANRIRLTTRGRAFLGTFGVGVGMGLALSLQTSMVAFAASGPASGAVLGQSALPDLEFRVQASRFQTLDGAQLHLGDEDVTDQAEITEDVIAYRPGALPDGQHELVLTVDRGFPLGVARQQWDFAVDTTPPELAVTEPAEEVEADDPVTVAGTVEPGASLLVDGEPLAVDDGRFSFSVTQPPVEPLVFTATDPVGNVTEQEFLVPVARSRPDAVRAVHVTAYAWVTPSLRDPILQMIREGKINSVELDLKDESGDIGYDSQIPLAQEIGAARGI